MKYVIPIVVILILTSGCIASRTQDESVTPVPTILQTSIVPVHTIAPGTCDQSLWKHVYHPERLKVIEQCKTITGTLVNYKKEPDGDYHFRLDVDDKSLINQANVKSQHGYLVMEPICQNEISQADAEEPCQGYNGPYFDPTKFVGKHISVTGSYVSDLEHDGWMEIHPIMTIDEIP